MKNKQTNLLIIALILTGFAISCSMFGGSNSNVANNSTPANANANTASAAKTEDLPMLAAPKLLDMLGKDVKGFNDQFKDREMIVIGEVGEMEANSFYFTAGYGKSISCTLSAEGAGEKADRLQIFVDQYVSRTRPKMPIVEARGIFRTGVVQGSDTTAVMEKCSIVSVKE
jgi:hypothetical protein